MVFINRCSPTKYETICQCLLKFKLRYIDRIDEVFNDNVKDTDHLQWGSFVHKIFEVGENADTVDDLRIIAEEERPKYNFKNNRLKSLDKILRNFLTFNNKIKANSVGSEIEFEIKENDVDIITTGKIDRVVKGKDGRYLVIDYKTGKQKNRAELMRNMQLVTYIFAVCKLYDTTPDKVRVAHFYPVTGDLVDLQIPGMIYNNVRKKWKSKIWSLRKLKKKDLKPTLNEFCNWCEFKGICHLHTPKSVCEERITAYEQKKIIKEELKAEKLKILEEQKNNPKE
jgi:ATP-dependent helicase/DNAse subunit B